MSQSSVVYFDQCTGAVHLRCWSISAFLSFLHQNDAQMMQKCENVWKRKRIDTHWHSFVVVFDQQTADPPTVPCFKLTFHLITF